MCAPYLKASARGGGLSKRGRLLAGACAGIEPTSGGVRLPPGTDFIIFISGQFHLCRANIQPSLKLGVYQFFKLCLLPQNF